jgi:hypothetical protein
MQRSIVVEIKTEESGVGLNKVPIW